MDRVIGKGILLGTLLAAVVAAQTTGPGIPRIRFAANEVGTKVFQKEVPEVNGSNHRIQRGQMFQGYFMLFEQRGQRTTVYDLANPRSPREVSTFGISNRGQDHTVPSVGTHLILSGVAVDLTDPAKPRVRGRAPGDAGIFPAFQWPYHYNTSTYDANGQSTALTIIDYTDLDNPRLAKRVDVQSTVGFATGSCIIIGNLLVITSGDVYAGVSVWDISDPLNPQVLSAAKSGPGTYVGQVYGKYIVTTGPKNIGRVGIWDMSNPTSLKLVYDAEIPGMGDYGTFQNGYLFGSRVFTNQAVTFDMATFKKASTIRTSLVSRYVTPMGNMMWVGDIAENLGRLNNWGFYSHAAGPDSIGPSVLFVNPPDMGVRQARTSRIGLALDEEVDNRTLTPANLVVQPVGGAPLAGIWTHQQGIINFTPSQPLEADKTYIVTVKAGGIKDWTGNPIAKDFVTRFSTGSAISNSTLIGPSRGPVSDAQLRPSPGSIVFRYDFRGRTFGADGRSVGIPSGEALP